MNLPEGITEEQFVATVNSIADSLCNKFKFGYYTREDIRQECFIRAIDGLERYDNKRPLINFLWSHIHNRLCNLKRDEYMRLEKPCDNCPMKAYIKNTDSCKLYENKLDCDLYYKWHKNNSNKQNIMDPIGIAFVNDENENSMHDTENVSGKIAVKEIMDIIDINISIGMRKYWLQQKSGVSIPKKFYSMLLEEIHEILKENNIDVSQTW